MINEQRIKKLFLFVVFALFALTLSLQAFALTFAPIPDVSAEETKTITFNVSLSEFNGTTSFSASPHGTILKLNNSLGQYSWTPSAGDIGNHTIYFTATDDLATITSQNIITVTRANNPPSIISAYAGSELESQVMLYVQTDISCICKYATSNVSFSSMPYTLAQSNAEKTIHEGRTPSLSSGRHDIYILCTDNDGSYMQAPYVLHLNINQRPTASISITPSAPLREGTVEVKLTASEPLIGTPELKYIFDDDSTPRNIALMGTGTSWQGYLIIKDTDSERVGSFTYKGYDMSNLEGTEITSGKLFLVDTSEPSAIESVRIENLDDKIKLSWEKKSNENIKEFRIFRKEASGGTDYVDYYKSTDRLYIYDSDVEYSKAYYYRVSAIDDAGNEGPLSKEVFVTHLPIEEKIDDAVPEIEAAGLEPKLEYILTEKITELDKTLIDISKAEETIGRLLGSDNIDSVEILGVLDKISGSEQSITNLKSALENLKTQSLSETEFNTEIQKVLSQKDAVWEETPLEVKVLDSSAYQEFNDDAKTKLAVSEYIREFYPQLTEKQTQDALSEASALQDSITVDVKIIKGEVKYPSQTRPFAIVKKSLSSQNTVGKAVLFEYIPKAVNPHEAVFSMQPYFENETVFWNTDNTNGEEISYYINADINIADLKNSKSIIFDEQNLINSSAQEPGNSITGGVVGASDAKSNILLALIVAGVMIVCGLFAYYIFWSEEEKENNASEAKTEKNENARFSIKKALFRKKEESIIPDSKRIITIEKPESEVHHATDSYNFETFHGAGALQRQDETLDSSPIFRQKEEKNEEIHNRDETGKKADSLSELDLLGERLIAIKQNARISDIEDFDALRNKTHQIKNLCEELEEQSIIEFTNKTKENLEKSLLYIAKYSPPVHTGIKKEEPALEKNQSGSAAENSNTKANPMKADAHMAASGVDAPEQIMKANTESVQDAKKESEKQSVTRVNSTPHRAPAHQAFVFADGSRISTISELKDSISAMDESTFRTYANKSKNDFATWIGDVFMDYDLAHKVRFAKTREETIEIL